MQPRAKRVLVALRGPQVEAHGPVIHGTEGRIEVGVTGGVRLRLRRFGAPNELPELPPAEDATTLSVLDLLECLETGREPELSSRKALRATELIFATYQNAGVRAFDIGDPYRPLEVGALVPPAPARMMDQRPGRARVIQSADVFVDAAGLIYCTDYNAGLYILEFNP